MRRYGLRDDQWDRIKDFLPGRGRWEAGRKMMDLCQGRGPDWRPITRRPDGGWRLENGPSTFQPVGEEWHSRASQTVG